MDHSHQSQPGQQAPIVNQPQSGEGVKQYGPPPDQLQQQQNAPIMGQPQPYQYGGVPVQQQYGMAPAGQMYGNQQYMPQYGMGPVAGQPPMPPGAPMQPQPKPEEWMPRVAATPNCPPGLEYLTQIDQILVHQQMELLEMLTGYETENKYIVKNSVGQRVFFAAENSSFFQRCCCSNIRHFEMNILDNFGNEVMHLHRPLRCQSCLYPCCLQTMEVTAPPGTVIGSIEQQWSIFPSFKIKDAAGDVVCYIRGPLCPFSCCGDDVNFHVIAKDGETKIGKITKQWGGFLREAYTDADMFGINFPMDLDVKVKAVLLGACFLIDFMYFEHNQDNNRY